ncbi:hypothetical protein [Streptomyces sp. NBC_00316]|uniref:hypothetical protein n=1 Tax=Streptomyces sp. NBC_00316 TaxID=2975710 RepID=UPI002E2E60CC|nr:hypothetical protein [Streptomyces sp. NBC_00316]
MNARFGVSRGKALTVAALAAIVASTISGSASALVDGTPARSEHWGVIARNTIGSPVADLRDGPYGSFGVTGSDARPPYGQGSLGIEVAGPSTPTATDAEKVDFGNEVDFYGDPVLGLTKLGFRVFQTGENQSPGADNLPAIRFEIDPNVTSNPSNYASLVWVPAALTATNKWSPYIDATSTGRWFLTGAWGACDQSHPACTFADVKNFLNDGGQAPTIYTVAVGKGRDHAWVGAVDGLRINNYVYDFEADGVKPRRVL